LAKILKSRFKKKLYCILPKTINYEPKTLESLRDLLKANRGNHIQLCWNILKQKIAIYNLKYGKDKNIF